VSLYTIQFANYILPLVTIPYLVRVLGPEKFGAVAFGQSLMAYFALFTNYGFDWSATRRIAVHQNDSEMVSRTAAAVWVAKALLCGIGFLALLFLISFIPRIKEVSLLLLILYGIVLGNMLFPTWLFQGLERMVAISVINLAMRTLSTAGIFALIHRPEDFLLLAGLISFQWMGAGLIGLWTAFARLNIRLSLPSRQEVRQALAEGWTLFLSTGAISLYTSGNAFILGMLTNHVVVGYYSAVERLVKGIAGLFNPISQAIFPRLSKLASISTERTFSMGRSVLLLLGSLGLLLSAVLMTSATYIVRVALGSQYLPSVTVLRILAPVVFNISTATVWAILFMLSFRRDKAVLVIVFLAGIINLSMAILLVPLYQETGMAIAYLVAETFVNIGSFIYTWVHHINPLRGIFSFSPFRPRGGS
jgi:PST family polysaccharide transporter